MSLLGCHIYIYVTYTYTQTRKHIDAHACTVSTRTHLVAEQGYQQQHPCPRHPPRHHGHCTHSLQNVNQYTPQFSKNNATDTLLIHGAYDPLSPPSHTSAYLACSQPRQCSAPPADLVHQKAAAIGISNGHANDTQSRSDIVPTSIFLAKPYVSFVPPCKHWHTVLF